MKPFLSLLLAPALSFAAVSGTVTLLDGTPIAGALLQTSKDTATSSASGSFTMARAAGITSRLGKTVPVTSHLTLENGHPRLDFSGFDLSGRTQRSSLGSRLQPPGRAEGSLISGAGRSAEATDTLRVYWKGKRLTVLPVPSDTSVTLRIDTAWDSDYGFSWDPTAEYGTLHDSRDGRVYRTLQIGAQTWMAENLRYEYGECYYADFSGQGGVCEVEGRLYSWDGVAQKDTGTVIHGICPTGWHVPSDTEWGTMLDSIKQVKSMRVILAGYIPSNQTLERYSGRGFVARFWVSTKWVSNDGSNGNQMYRNFSRSKYSSWGDALSLRCIKDTP